jgi:hypothetical protein
MSNEENNGENTHAVQLVVTWLLVGIPLLWGVLKTLQNAWKLFS